MPKLSLPSGDARVGLIGVAVIAIYLLGLTFYLIRSIITQWPPCDVTVVEREPGDPGQSDAGGANRNSADGNVNANVNSDANVNSNTNVNTNQNNENQGNANGGAATGGGGAATGGATPAAPARAEGQGPDLDSIEPKSGTIRGGTPVLIRGRRLTADLVVEFDGRAARATHLISGETMSVNTPAHAEGRVDVTVRRKDVPAAEDVLPGGYEYTCPAPSGSGLFLIIALAGALGGVIHAIRSLAWYVGNRELVWSWMLLYLFLPFSGAALALVFSMLIVAGVIDAAGRSESLFIVALAGLVGMFSQQAALKLTDVANAFFTKPGEGEDAKTQKSLSVGAGGQTGTSLKAAALSPAQGLAAGDQDVTITGEGFTDDAVITFGGKPATVVKPVTATTIKVKTPSGTAGDEVEVEVKAGGRTAKTPTKYKYT